MRNTRQTCRNLANVPHFHGKKCRNPRILALYKTAHCGTAIKVWRGHQSVARPSKCGAHGGRKAAHMTPRFQVPRWCICCILFYVNCMWVGIHHCAFVRSSLLFSLSLLPPLLLFLLCSSASFPYSPPPLPTSPFLPPHPPPPPLSLSLSLYRLSSQRVSRPVSGCRL